MSVPWTQPTLGGPSVRRFTLSSEFRWPLGWRGYLTAEMEGEHHSVELVRWSELTTDQLWADMATSIELIRALIYNDQLPDEPGPTA